MEEIPLSRTYLESLATGDLIKIADNLGIDITDNPDRVFIIEELLDSASGDEAGASHEKEMTDSGAMESVPLPKNYNIAFIEVMIRDPFWAFVFWEIKASDAEQFEKADDFSGYYLKISPLGNSDNFSQTDGAFTIPVKGADTAWYLGLAPVVGEENPLTDQCQYKVEFCASLAGAETVLAVSNPVRLPGTPVLPPGAGKQEPSGVWGNQLARLSGYADFHMLQRNERPLRTKKDGPASSNE